MTLRATTDDPVPADSFVMFGSSSCGLLNSNFTRPSRVSSAWRPEGPGDVGQGAGTLEGSVKGQGSYMGLWKVPREP